MPNYVPKYIQIGYFFYNAQFRVFSKFLSKLIHLLLSIFNVDTLCYTKFLNE